MPTKEETIAQIENRIVAEYNKHPKLNWAKIAAIKIYAALIEKAASAPHVCPNCWEPENFHGNYDYSKPDRPLINTTCNECGRVF